MRRRTILAAGRLSTKAHGSRNVVHLFVAATLCLPIGCTRTGFAPPSGSEGKQLVIVLEQGALGAPVGDVSLQVGQALQLRARLLASDGTPLGDEVTASWAVVGTDLPAADLAWAPPASATATLQPSTTGAVAVGATYQGDDPMVTDPTAITGEILVTSAGEGALIVVSGDQQTAVVNNPLAEPFVVQVLDKQAQPAVGVSVAFEVLEGGGALVDTSPVVSDSAGQVSMRARVGTIAGTNNQRFRAHRVDLPAVATDIVASALPGPLDHIAFSAQPSGGYAGSTLAVQPQVEAQDAYGNRTSASDPVTLSVQVGTGTLTGTTEIGWTDGLAAFVGVAYSAVESGVVLRATSGGLSVDSDPFDVLQAPPGACLIEDALFATRDGGCKDLSPGGLVWSAPSPGTMNWATAVWDASVSSSAVPDNEDLGRSNDYPEDANPCSDPCDGSGPAYCHDLVEGGKRDWRVPSLPELLALISAAGAGAGSAAYLPDVRDEWLWTSTSVQGTTGKDVVNLSTGLVTYTTYPYRVRCVRGGRLPADHLALLGYPRAVGVGTRPGTSISIAVQDAAGHQVNAENTRVTLAVTSGATLSGTLTATTDVRGRAVLGAWQIDTVGDVELTVSAPGLQAVRFTIHVGPFPHTCAVEDGKFLTQDGGCKDLTTNLVWSLASLITLTWYEAIWDSANPVDPPNAQPDEYDGGRTNDYGDTPTYPDTSTTNYCHALDQGGFLDWRVPTFDELLTVYQDGQGATTHFSINTNQKFWSSVGSFNSPYASTLILATGVRDSDNKGYDLRTICVREAP